MPIKLRRGSTSSIKNRSRSGSSNRNSATGVNYNSNSPKYKAMQKHYLEEFGDISDKGQIYGNDGDTYSHSSKNTGRNENKSNRKIPADNFGKHLRDSKRFIFTLGAFLGVLIAFYFGATHVHSTNKDLFTNMVNFEFLNDYIDDWKDVIPQGFQSFIADFPVNLDSEGSFQSNLSGDFAVGKQLKKELQLKAFHPVVMVPGVTSTGLENWGIEGDEECDSSPHFRKRLWGSFYMLRVMVLDKVCWLKHVMLDPETGLDPANFRLRAAQGFEASDFFVAGYWIWNKIIQNLGVIGYDPDKMTTAAYDWRLSYQDLERRDKYFSKLKQQIELTFELNASKSVLIGHSMGAQVVFYFLKWVEAEGPNYGNGGPGWVNKYIDSFINVSGTLLGAPKAVPALISGEMKDTIQLNAIAMYGLEKFFSRRERLNLLRTWGSIPSMFPKGGDLIWGNHTFSYEDLASKNSTSILTSSFGPFIKLEKSKNPSSKKNKTKKHMKTTNDKTEIVDLSMEDSINLVKNISPSWLQKRIDEQNDYGYANSCEELLQHEKDHKYWTNPLQVPLPNATDMKIYCIYGINNPTERAYIYKEGGDGDSLNMTIDYESANPVLFTDGDGTVPLMAHSLCHKWAQGKSPYNPANMSVTIIEIQHQPDRFDIRGGPKSAEHVDILGSSELNEYVLKIASGLGSTVANKLLSPLKEWVEMIDFPM
ncbi:hypothetical protein TPHA_0D03660 [Tetrapisispora phaffii CBS 4417]|uniref:Phospholipid:diacylglycerol acyltransferase n=1 Tax=Tetrapisispora phaffii (strain ATCC 24235 / CBS 4417 / NBRC 1672 / NRRL Y-8282 / UCD 70-5) TaxID=1071381 RepID=G8BT30_TETPH|nr:hypothetical protein TPHA_0D03660 [Tetrapisispora phaffii CBS 4417]CCE63001.1 hypothetical protein TPHA_0D03660 [Tetrapisispora phaffii CBS 4417]